MKRKNQILAGIVSALFAIGGGVLYAGVEDARSLWVLGGVAVFAAMAVYNFAPMTVGDFFREAGRTVNEVRDDDS